MTSLISRLSGCAIALFSLHGCMLAPPAESNSDWARLKSDLQELTTWELRGRVNIRYEGESHTPESVGSKTKTTTLFACGALLTRATRLLQASRVA